MRKSFDQMEREQMGRPMRLSIVFHICVLVALVVLIYVSGFFHGSEWGNNAPSGAIQATLVASAPSLPLPQTVPPNKNVLATQTPSKAPSIPTKQTESAPSPKSIAIQARRHPKKKLAHERVPKRVKPKKLKHRVNYGERQEASIPHAPKTVQKPAKTVTVDHGGNFASLYPWYVSQITRDVSNNWFEQEVDPSTPEGTKVSVTFRISSGGGVSDIRITQPSGSPTLNRSGLRAVQRVGSFGPLPSSYKGSYIEVEYTFTYKHTSQ